MVGVRSYNTRFFVDGVYPRLQPRWEATKSAAVIEVYNEYIIKRYIVLPYLEAATALVADGICYFSLVRYLSLRG